MSGYSDLLPLAVEAVEQASRIMLQHAPGTLRMKGDRDLASEVDFEIERTARAFLREQTPGIGFVGEEEGSHGPDTLHWVLDPVDGTVNFVRGLPLCGISLALVHHRRPVLGVIDLPFLNTRYTAAHHQGAHVNGRPIRASNTPRLDEAIVAIGDYAVGPDAAAKNRRRLALTAKLAERVRRIRMNGSAATDLAWLADGRLDASLTLSNHEWDMAAGVIIAREAGARIVDLDGTEHTSDSAVTLAISPGIADDLFSLVQESTQQVT